MDQPIAVLYEHPQWFVPLFAELDRRGVPYEAIDGSASAFDPSELECPYSLVVNRMSPSAWTRGHTDAIFHTLHYLAYLDDIGAPVFNGHRAFQVEVSKVRQCTLFRRLGVRFPKARGISHPSQAEAAAEGLKFPVVVKPNVGGSGAGIRAFETPDELRRDAVSGDIDLGIDHTGLVQEYLPAQGNSIVRIEILGGRFLYAIRLLLTPGAFNLCPADYCEMPGVADAVSGRGRPVEGYEPPAAVVEDARRITAAAGMDAAGVEYLVNDRDGLPYFYDVNALSNFVADAPRVVGFDPFVDLVDLILERAKPRTGPSIMEPASQPSSRVDTGLRWATWPGVGTSPGNPTT